VMRPEKRWCFAQGTTQDGADTWILVQNPNPNPTKVVVSFYYEGGGTGRQPMDLPGMSRKSLYTNLVKPDASFGICVDADDPVVAERATYTEGGGGNDSIGVSAPALDWYFAEGSSGPLARTTLAISNPSTEAASVEITYLIEGAAPKKRTLQVPPMGKTQIDTASDSPGTAFGMALKSTKPVVAERSTYFGSGMAGTHSTIGSTTLAKTWYLAEGSTGQPFQEYVMVANPGSAPANVTLDFMRTDGTILPKTFQVQPQSRATIDANAVIPNSAVSVRVRSDQPVVAERSMYWDNMNGGTGAIGVPWDR